MPTTLLGLVILLVLLGPGFAYIVARERRFPTRHQSPFREVTELAAASILLNGLVLVIFWIARGIWPQYTVNIGNLVAHPHTYWVSNYQVILYWSIGLLGFASVVGYVGGRLLPESSGSIYASSWWRLFEIYPNTVKWVGCQLSDGSYISGQLYSYDMNADEDENRDIVIRDPQYRSPTGKIEANLGSALTAISARNIVFLSVAYQDIDPPIQLSLKDRAARAWTAFNEKTRAPEPTIGLAELEGKAADAEMVGVSDKHMSDNAKI